MDEAPDKLVQLRLIFDGTLFHRVVDYPVLVEMWPKSKFGRVRRAYESRFDEQERTLIDAWYRTFHRWHVRQGTPLKVACAASTVEMMQRAVEFFGTV